MPDNAICEACGSFDIWRSKSSRLDKLVRFLTSRKRFKCNRCGWTALRPWDGGFREKRGRVDDPDSDDGRQAAR